jgi:hypothetical protein
MMGAAAAAPELRAESAMSTRRVVLRVALAFLGGYAFSAGLVAALAALCVWCGLAAAEAAVLSGMLGFLIYLGVLLWAFATPRPRRAALLVLAGAACSHGLALALHSARPLLVLAPWS